MSKKKKSNTPKAKAEKTEKIEQTNITENEEDTENTEKEENTENKDTRSFWKMLWDEWIVSILIALVAALIIRIFIFAPTIVIGPSMESTLQDPSYKVTTSGSAVQIGNTSQSDRLIAEKVSLLFGRTPKQGEIITFSEPTSTYYITEGFFPKIKAYLFDRRDYIKRVIAVGGDTVKFSSDYMTLNGLPVSDYSIEGNKLYVNGTAVEGDADFLIQKANVYVNGVKLDEPYLDEDYSIYISVANGVIDTSTGSKSDINIDLTVPEGYVYVMGDNRKVSFDSRKFTKDTATSTNRAYASENGCIKVSEITGRVIWRFWPLNRIGTID